MSEKKNESKKLYVKPRMQTIDLSADEVMTANCKTDSGAGGISEQGGTSYPANGCVISGCGSEIGS